MPLSRSATAVVKIRELHWFRRDLRYARDDSPVTPDRSVSRVRGRELASARHLDPMDVTVQVGGRHIEPEGFEEDRHGRC